MAKLTKPSLLGEVERGRVRCSVCRSALPVTVLWAVGESCPRCSGELHACRRHTTGVPPARTVALPYVESANGSGRLGLARQ
ncbi:MAG TPA: hypothetical protein VKG38_02460 [Solirubrobacteraceae bacterium]|nr:hypothetical protein [Solirubrobacteraceae bacterium]